MNFTRRSKTWAIAGAAVGIAGLASAWAAPTAVHSPSEGAKAKQANARKESAIKNRGNLPKLLSEVEKKYTESPTLVAEFSQVNESAALKQKKTSSGLIMVKRPDKVRWETLRPDPNLLVSDGKRLWYYTPPFDEGERGQVIERKSSEIHTQLTHALLSGSFSAARDMKITRKSPSHFILTPKPGTAGTVSRAEIHVDPKQKLIRKVILVHLGGNRSEITLSNIELGRELKDDLFYFIPPPDTDRVS